LGATSWRHYTAYDEDSAAALERLRADVFRRGEYVDLTGPTEDALRNTYRRFGRDPDDAESRRDIAQSLPLQRAVDSGKKEDLAGLSEEDRAFARRMRWVMRIARWFGAAPPAQ